MIKIIAYKSACKTTIAIPKSCNDYLDLYDKHLLKLKLDTSYKVVKVIDGDSVKYEVGSEELENEMEYERLFPEEK